MLMWYEAGADILRIIRIGGYGSRHSPGRPGEVAALSSRRRGSKSYFAPTAVLRQARCTAQVQPGGCDASWVSASFAALSLAGTDAAGARVGIASLTRRSCAERSCVGM